MGSGISKYLKVLHDPLLPIREVRSGYGDHPSIFDQPPSSVSRRYLFIYTRLIHLSGFLTSVVSGVVCYKLVKSAYARVVCMVMSSLFLILTIYAVDLEKFWRYKTRGSLKRHKIKNLVTLAVKSFLEILSDVQGLGSGPQCVGSFVGLTVALICGRYSRDTTWLLDGIVSGSFSTFIKNLMKDWREPLKYLVSLAALVAGVHTKFHETDKAVEDEFKGISTLEERVKKLEARVFKKQEHLPRKINAGRPWPHH